MRKLKYVLISLFLAIGIVVLAVVVIARLWSGWLTFAGNRFYLEDGELAKGFTFIDDQWYYFNSSGVMQSGFHSIDGDLYFFYNDGTMHTGWLDQYGNLYYFDSDGVQQTGLTTIDGSDYYFDDGGVMQTGFQTVDGNQYYFDDTGTAHIGWLYEGNETYYCLPSIGGMFAKGKWEIDGERYYFHESGQAATGEWSLDDGRTYVFDDMGRFLYCEVSEDTLSYSVSSSSHSFSTGSGSYADYYFNILYTPVINCTSIDGRFDIDQSYSGSPNGTWLFYIRTTSGVWKEVDRFTVSNQEGDFSVYFDTPCSFDAYTCVQSSGEWSGSFYAKIGCEYRSSDFGDCQYE